MDIDSFVVRLAGVQSRSREHARVALLDQCHLLMKDFMKRSPVDSGHFQSLWHISNVGAGGGIAFAIRNPAPYSVPLDEGAPKGGPPWNFPKGGARGGTLSKSGKLILRNNRVWAGGKSPEGHVVGGITGYIFLNNRKRQKEVANAVADGIIKAI